MHNFPPKVLFNYNRTSIASFSYILILVSFITVYVVKGSHRKIMCLPRVSRYSFSFYRVCPHLKFSHPSNGHWASSATRLFSTIDVKCPPKSLNQFAADADNSFISELTCEMIIKDEKASSNIADKQNDYKQFLPRQVKGAHYSPGAFRSKKLCL